MRAKKVEKASGASKRTRTSNSELITTSDQHNVLSDDQNVLEEDYNL